MLKGVLIVPKFSANALLALLKDEITLCFNRNLTTNDVVDADLPFAAALGEILL